MTGGLLATGTMVRSNAWYGAHDLDAGFRWLQCYRTLGALLLLLGFVRALGLAFHGQAVLSRSSPEEAAP